MLLVIDNYDSFTWNLVQAVRVAAPELEVRVVQSDNVSLDQAAKLQPAGVLCAPGPGTPNDAGVCIELIRWAAGRVPLLGVCLGHQCIAAAFGLHVGRAEPVHGKTALVHHDGISLFRGVRSPTLCMRYHSLAVDPDAVAADPRWEVSARAEDGTVMGIRRAWEHPLADNAPLEGVQFHPESFRSPEGPTILGNFLANLRKNPRQKPSTKPSTKTPESTATAPAGAPAGTPTQQQPRVSSQPPRTQPRTQPNPGAGQA